MAEPRAFQQISENSEPPGVSQAPPVVLTIDANVVFSTPPHQDEDARMRDHLAMVAEYESRGQCWASGYSIPVCRATICDCFDYDNIEPAGVEQINAEFYQGDPPGQ